MVSNRPRNHPELQKTVWKNVQTVFSGRFQTVHEFVSLIRVMDGWVKPSAIPYGLVQNQPQFVFFSKKENNFFKKIIIIIIF
jgi:hypothetical protein